ncbi:polysaccharide deacetylase family protein [Arcanobacterium canis]
MNTRRILTTASIGLLTVLAACSPTPQTSTVATTSASSDASPSTTPQPSMTQSSPPASTPTPTPTDSASPTSAARGTNHIASAKSYAYPAKDVHDWLLRGTDSPTYPKNKKIVFITMDDGPNTSTTARNLDTFKKAGVHATFYDVGLSLGDPEVQKLMKRQYDEGHAVAIHSNKHNYSFLYPGRHCNPTNVINDFDILNEKMKKILGPDWSSNTYRYPGGHMSWKDMAPCDAALEKRGVYWLDWNAGTNDAVPPRSQPKTTDKMLNTVIRTSGDKNVVVLLSHDARGKEMTLKTMPRIIDYFKSQGYEFGIIGG